jgi:hypothetical protein
MESVTHPLLVEGDIAFEKERVLRGLRPESDVALAKYRRPHLARYPGSLTHIGPHEFAGRLTCGKSRSYY